MPTIAVYAGSFDPMTRGHEELARRSRTFVDELVIAVRFGAKRLAEFFTDCREVGRVRNDREVVNEVFDTPIYVCRGLRQPWAQTWDKMRFFS